MRSTLVERLVSVGTLLAVLLVIAAGCSESEGEPAATLAPTPVATETPTQTPMPSPTLATIVEAWNVTQTLSGLEITLTVAHWTGDGLLLEWTIANRSGRVFNMRYLNDIFSLGSAAVDQDGNEGEYFIPSPFERNVQSGETVPHETRWLFYPESKTITVRLRDLREPASGTSFDTVAEFRFSR